VLCVGLAGGSGAGKSALAGELARALGPERVLVLTCDAYYRDRPDLDAAARAAQNFDHPDALETDLLAAQLDALRAGRAVDVPSYDFALHRRRAETRRAQPHELVIVDGLLVLCDPALRARFDLRVFVAASERHRLERRLARDVAERGRSPESVRAQLAATVQPMHAAFVEPSRAHADLVVANDAELAQAAAQLLARVRELLAPT
jgi:uridine kinase